MERKHRRAVSKRGVFNELYSGATAVWRPEWDPIVREADIIHLHWVANYVNHSTFFKAVKQPIVWTLHDLNPFTGGFHYHYNLDLNPFEQLYAENLRLKEEGLTQANLTLVTPSDYLKQESLKSSLHNRFKHYTIPNGVDTDVYKRYDKMEVRKLLGLPESRKLVLFVSDYLEYERKGLGKLQEALRLDKQDIDLVIVGKSGQNFELNGYRVHAMGRVDDEAMLAKIYAATDVYVNSSLADISSNTVMEALCCGTPVVVFNTGGIPELIDQTNAIVCRHGDSQNLARGLGEALVYAWDRDAISKAAQNRFGLNRLSEDYLALYRKILPAR